MNSFDSTKGNGLFVFSDPGGAKPLMSHVLQCSDSLQNYRIISDRRYTFLNTFNLEVDFPSSSIEEDFKKISANFLFTGTSYTSSVEILYLIKAKELGIPSCSFIDHSTNILSRFQFDGTLVFPDYVLVPDKEILERAIIEGIPENSLKIFPNPYHSFLKIWKPEKNKDEALRNYGINPDKRKIILFAPDPLSNFPEYVSEHGFNEADALGIFMPYFRQMKDRSRTIIVPHPNQNISLLRNTIETGGDDYLHLISEGYDLNDLIYYSDVVVGFFSNILVESTLIGVPVLRYVLNEGVDPLRSRGIGHIVNNHTFGDVFMRHLSKFCLFL